MKHKWNLFNSSILKNCIISYSIVLFIPLMIVFSFLYNMSIKTVKEQIYDAQITKVNQIKRTMDSKIKAIKSIVNFLDNNVELDKIINLTEDQMSPGDYLDIAKISKRIAVYQAVDIDLEKIYVYIKSSDRCITDNNSTSSYFTYEDLHKNQKEYIYYEQWLERLQEYHKGGFVVFKNNNSKYSYNGNLYYMQSLHILPPGNSVGTVVIKFSPEFIRNTMSEGLLSQSTYNCILDQNNNILVANQKVSPIEIDYSMFKDDMGYITNKDYLISYVRSSNSSVMYVSVVSEKAIMRKLLYTKRLSISVLLICICLGACLTGFFTIRNYNPVKEILNISRKIYPYDIDKKNIDEYSEIQLALLEALDDKIKYQDKCEEELQMQKQNKLYNVLTDDSANEDTIKSELDNHNIYFKENYFCAIKVILSDYSESVFEYESKPYYKTKAMVACKEVYQEFLKTLSTAVVFLRQGYMLIIVNIKQNITVNKIKDTVLNAQKFLRDNYAVDSYASISSIKYGLKSINHIIKEAHEAMEYYELTGKGTVVIYEDYSQLDYEQRLKKLYIKEEQVLIGNILSNDFDGAKKNLNNIFERYFFDTVESPQLIRFRLFSLINNIINSLMELDMPNKEKIIQNLNPYERILNSNNAYEMQQQLNLIMDEFKKLFKTKENSKEYELKKRIIKIVKENYTDPNLNVSFIADKIGENINTISREFKKTTLIGLLDYIHHTRISAAKKIIKNEPNITIQQVSSRVGYTSCDSFIRAFKRIEGMTPGQYKKFIIKKSIM